MPKIPIIDFNRSYTFSNYFDLPYEPEDILAEFEYSLVRSRISFPRTSQELKRLSILKEQIEESRPLISLTSEMARREFLIAPILLEVARVASAKLSSEYPMVVTDQLKGSLDYFLRSEGQLLIVEANIADLDRGFTQLAVELIALEQWTDFSDRVLQGVVSNGTTWIFGQLDRTKKQVTQDIEFYTVPANLEDLLRILVAILEGACGLP